MSHRIPTYQRLTPVIVALAICLLLALAFALPGCAFFKKAQSSYQKRDSTSSHIENHDSLSVKSTVEVKKVEEAEDNTIIINFGDTGIYKPSHDSGLQDNSIYVWPKMAEDYFTVTDKGEIKTSRIPTRVIIKNLKQAVKSDSSSLKELVNENHSKIEDTHVTNTQKEVTKAKYSFNLLWLLWLLVIPAIAWIYRNRGKIVGWVKAFITGV